MLALLLVAVAVAALDELIRRRAETAIAEGEDSDLDVASGAARRLARDRWLAGGVVLAGYVVLAAGSA